MVCVGSFYEFVFIFNIFVIYEVFGLFIFLIDVSILVEDGIGNLLVFMDYVCNLFNCVFVVNFKGCIIVLGMFIVDEIGMYDLIIVVDINVGFVFDVIVFGDFENGLYYYFNVKEEGGINCFFNINEAFVVDFGLSNCFNLFGDFMQVVVDVKQLGLYQFFVMDLLGCQVY